MSDKFGAFIDAVRSGDCAKVRSLCERDFINKRDTKFGWTALHWACCNNNDDIVKYLLSEGADIDIETVSFGWRPIHFAVLNGRTSVMTTLIERGCSINCVDTNGQTPLDLAMERRNEDCVRILRAALTTRKEKNSLTLSKEKNETALAVLKEKEKNETALAVLKEKEKNETALTVLKESSLSKIVDIERGRTVLDQLVDYHDEGIMQEIRSKPVDEQEIKDWLSLKLRRVDPQSYRLLHQCLLWRCIRHRYDDGVYTLCTAEIVNTDSLFMGPSPLETAIEFGTVFWVKHILDKLVQEDESWTRAAKIAKDKNLSNISSLISERKDYLNGKKTIGFTRLHTAVLDNDPDMVEFILSNKIVNPDEVHKIYGTALSMAYSLNQLECVQILQNNNVNVNIFNKLGQSPLHVAVTNGIVNQCDYLVNNTENIEAKDYMNFTVLEQAVMNDCEKVCDLLVKRGARCDKYMDPATWLDINRDSAVILKNGPILPITKKETVYSLCLKINRTIYPCLVATMDKHAVDRKDGEDNTILHICAIFLIPRLCSEMILKLANVNAVNECECTPLLDLLKYHQGGNMEKIGERLIETVNVLIEGGASLNVKDYTDRSVIDRATEFHNEKLLLTLIQKKERLECVLQPQLSSWLRNKYFTMIKEVIPLLNKSLLSDWISKNLIGNILTETDISLVIVMYEHASYDVKTSVVETILYKAASVGNKILFDSLINDEISTNSSLECGESLLICLIREKKGNFIQLLLRSRNTSKYLEMKNDVGKLPLHICIECDYWDVIDQLIIDTKSVNAEDNDGNTALSLLLGKLSENIEESVLYRLMHSVKILISKSADIYRVNKNGRTAISYCTLSHIKLEIESYARQYQQSQKQSISASQCNTSITTVPPTTADNTRQPGAQSLPMCSICVNEPMNCALNCGHVFCVTCAEKEVKCFICRAPITVRIKMFV